MPAKDTICENLGPVKAFKYVLSCGILAGAMFVIFYGVGNGLAVLPGPVALHFVLLFGAVTLLAYLEGLQVAILALENLDYTVYREQYPKGAKLMDIATRPDGVKKFLCGRQFFVVFVVFLVAQLTTFPTLQANGVPEWLFILVIDTGLSGALFVLMFGQLLPQITAADYPLQVCNAPGSLAVLYLCLGFEFLGVTDVSWLLAATSVAASNPDTLEFRQRTTNASMGSVGDTGVDEEKGGATPMKASQNAQVDWDAVLSAAVQGAPVKVTELPLDKNQKQLFNKYPSPEDLCKYLTERGQAVPRFLLPVEHPDHVPPHLVAATSLIKDKALGTSGNNRLPSPSFNEAARGF